MSKIEDLAESLVGLTLLEAAELKTLLKDKYGIEPAAGAVAVAAGPANYALRPRWRLAVLGHDCRISGCFLPYRS